MRRGSFPWRILTFGGRVPPAVGGLIVATALASLGGVVAERSGAHVLAELALVPSALLGGELWRLVTWPLVETDPLSLLFAGLTLYWFGRDLCLAWGPRRFLLTFFGLAAAAGLVTTLLGVLVFGGLLGAVYAGSWAVLSALVIAWATLFPERQILLMFALPMSGRALLWVTVGITLLYAVFSGFGAFVPHLVAQAIMLLYLRGFSVRGAWQSLRIRSQARRRASHLKVVKKDEPPRWMN